MNRTKIVITLGPSCDSPETITALIQNGVNVFRLNFSHGTHQSHKNYFQLIRNISDKLDLPIAILMDLQGPKIRTGLLKNGLPVTLVHGQPFIITTRVLKGDNTIVSSTWKSLSQDVKPGDRLLVSDGLIELKVERIDGPDVHCSVITGGFLSERQGINLPGVNLTAPALTEKDKKDLEFGLKLGVDYVALSFVRSANDLLEVKSIVSKLGFKTPVIAKIERPEALDNFPEILDIADGIMVARGDLGVEISPENVPLVQKQIIDAANQAGKPVITATQMLDSMIRNPRPTRAEASDVANAIIDGTDAVMLSGETATGKYPLKSVQMLTKIAPGAETIVSSDIKFAHSKWNLDTKNTISRSIADFACKLAETEMVKAILVLTQTGSTARLIACRRPQTGIFALTPNRDVYRQLALVWGVQPILTPFRDNLEILEEQIHQTVALYNIASEDDFVLLVGGHPLAAHGPTNFLKLLKI